ncbi:MAG: hypothetical protein HQL12_03370 [Candidatus Omnitrophica bacterium]|nr:hypothetical protein [Candidatus Omnitrophota bacterium]
MNPKFNTDESVGQMKKSHRSAIAGSMDSYYVFGTFGNFSPKVCKALQLGCRVCLIAIASKLYTVADGENIPVPNT